MFKKGFGKKNLVGVDIGSSSIKAVELQGKTGNLQLVSLGYEPRSGGAALARRTRAVPRRGGFE